MCGANAPHRYCRGIWEKCCDIIPKLCISFTFSTIEDTNAAVSTVEYFVPFQRWVGISLYPHAGHRIVEYLVLLQQPETSVVHQHSAVLPSPDLVPPDDRVTPSPGTCQCQLSTNKLLLNKSNPLGIYSLISVFNLPLF